MPSIIVRPIGPTVALSVVATSHAAVALTVSGNEYMSFASFLNPGALPVSVKVTPTGVAATLAVDGTPGDYVLPAAMSFPVVLPIPSLTPQVTAIATGAGPTIIYVTPVGIQS